MAEIPSITKSITMRKSLLIHYITVLLFLDSIICQPLFRVTFIVKLPLKVKI